MELDKPLSVCNALFTWLQGSELAEEELILAAEAVRQQIESCQLVQFLKAARTR